VESIKARLLASGLSEIITYSLIDPREVDKLQVPDGDPLRWFVKLMNPLSEELSVLRTTLLVNLLKVLKYNINREQYDVQVFEVGHIFWHENGKEMPDEEAMLGIALTGAWQADEWHSKARNIDFFDLKGAVEVVLDEIGVTGWSLRQFAHPALHPGKSAELLIGDEPIGYFGELHPDVLAAFDMPTAYVGELNMDKLIDNAIVSRELTEIPKHPAITLDIAVLVDDTVAQEKLIELIESEGKPLLEQAKLFDLYTGKGVPDGKKSMAYTMVFRAPERTLTDEETLDARDRIITRLNKELGAEIRM
jgi:phenylalanyl-tRNA synthetase beta chain